MGVYLSPRTRDAAVKIRRQVGITTNPHLVRLIVNTQDVDLNGVPIERLQGGDSLGLDYPIQIKPNGRCLEKSG